MLSTTAIKADSSVAAGGKDKDNAPGSLEADFSAYFSQMMAAMPAIQAAPAPVEAAQASAPAPRPPDPVKKAAQNPQNADVATAPASGSAQAQAQAQAQAAAAPASDSSTQQAASAPEAPTPAAPTPDGAPALAGAAKTAAPPPAGTAAQASAKPSAPQDTTPPQAAAPAAQTAQAAQDALNQSYPGGKFQVQIGDPGSVATTKAPLTEFVNQIPLPAKAGGDAQAGSLPDPAQNPAPQAAGVSAAGLETAAMQSLQAPLAGTAALLAPAPVEASVAGALAGTAAGALAVGAGALPGASGSVRVTASTAAEAPRAATQESLLSQVDGTIRFLVKNQDQSAELQLHPESLGRVQIKLKVEGTVVHAKVWASEASAVPVLHDQRSTLEASLKAQGLTLGSFDLQHGRREQEAPLPASTEPATPFAGNPALAKSGQENPAPQPVAAARTSRIEYVA